jgi:tetratricopeptide (TPR) repeat protein
MLGFGWLTLKQADEALDNGRLEEAQRLLTQPQAQGRRGVADRLARLARAYVERGERQQRNRDLDAAWRDLIQAEQLLSGDTSPERLRQALTRLGLAEVRALMQSGDPKRADEAVSRLRDKAVRSAELQVLDEAARDWLNAQDLVGKAEFTRAVEALDRAARLLAEDCPALASYRDEIDQKRLKFPGLLVKLHEAANAKRWQDVLELADRVLAVAPDHAEARKIRMRAWQSLEPLNVLPVTVPHTPALARREAETVAADGLPLRFLLWIDGVGGYLVCLGGRLTFGQATPDAHVDVPLVADVSRLHATLSRDSEGYVLEAVRAVQVNGQEVTRALLRNGDRVTVGTSCQFLFRQPVPVSASARLDLVSGHRLPVGVDGVLLMADTLVLGSGEQAHVTVPDLKEPIILFRNKDGLGYRHKGGLVINGRKSPERGSLSAQATVWGDDISFALEPVGLRLS